jgi:hypothetical protein
MSLTSFSAPKVNTYMHTYAGVFRMDRTLSVNVCQQMKMKSYFDIVRPDSCRAPEGKRGP